MSLFISNFLRRVADFARQNRARLIKLLLIVALAFAAAGLIYYGVEKWHGWKYEKAVQALDRRINEEEIKIKAAEQLINALKTEIAAKDALIVELDKAYEFARSAHGKTRTEYVYLRGEYEKTRDNPDVPASVSCADLRAELAELGIVR